MILANVNIEGLLFTKQALTISEVVKILENPPDNYTATPALQPKAEQAFRFLNEDADKQDFNNKVWKSGNKQ